MFNALLNEGTFFTEDNFDLFRKSGFTPYHKIFFRRKGNTEKVYLKDTFAPFMGEKVSFAMHHLINMDRAKEWGIGSCHLSTIGWCPCNHHKTPYEVLNLTAEGVLKEDGDHLFLEKFDGEKFMLPMYLLVGHDCRIAMATVFDVEKMKDTVFQDEDLKSQLDQMMDLMNKLRS